jgi:hypothetical protein
MNIHSTQTKPEPAKPVRFPSGRIVATPGALDILERYQIAPSALLDRHFTGDWGDLCDDDKRANAEAVEAGLRIFSSYLVKAPDGEADMSAAKVWVITEADRSATTLLLPEEY